MVRSENDASDAFMVKYKLILGKDNREYPIIRVNRPVEVNKNNVFVTVNHAKTVKIFYS